jgi:hypothetical protein
MYSLSKTDLHNRPTSVTQFVGTVGMTGKTLIAFSRILRKREKGMGWEQTTT